MQPASRSWPIRNNLDEIDSDGEGWRGPSGEIVDEEFQDGHEEHVLTLEVPMTCRQPKIGHCDKNIGGELLG